MSERPRMIPTSVTIGTSDSARLAHFWSELLGYRITADDPTVPGDPDQGGWAQVKPPEGEPGMTINIEVERYFARSVWPSEPGAPVATQHLDIWVEDLEASTTWALEHGAVLAERQPNVGVQVMFDPDGHPFCLFG